MTNEIKEIPEKILLFLYWEGTIDPNYLSAKKIEDETELSSHYVENGVKILREKAGLSVTFEKKISGLKTCGLLSKESK